MTNLRRCQMNSEQLEGKWEQVKGQIKEKWGKLTDNDLTVIKGKKDQLLGKLHERYGLGKEEAERELSGFLKNCKCSSDTRRDDTSSDSESTRGI